MRDDVTNGNTPTRRGATRRLFPVAILAFGAALCLSAPVLRAKDAAGPIPMPAIDVTAAPSSTREVAVLAGGCFWGVQGVYQHTNGVISAVSGYAGGDKNTAQYDLVSSGTTGHAESVRVTFDPRVITYGRILQIYFSVAHDPTELDRQGPDIGTQYRSAVFTEGAEQAKIVKAYIAQLDRAGIFGAAIVTKVTPLDAFYPAEDYHQDYLTLHPRQPYIVFNDLPKIEKLRRVYPDVYREKPVLVTTTGASN